MNFEYVIPKRLDAKEYIAPQRFRQNKDARQYSPLVSAGALVFSEIADHVQRMVTPTGVGGKLVYVYNFTDTAICMIDSRNGIVIIEPLQYSGMRDITNLLGTVMVEVVYHNQDQVISKASEVYLEARRDALVGLSLGVPTDNLYNTDHLYDTIATKASEVQRHRYTITKVSEILHRYGGAFYLSDVDIVIGEMRNPSKIWVHPNSESELKAKARPHGKLDESLDVTVCINDNHHVFDKAFINISGTALEVPVTRNPSQPEGISVWFNVQQPGTRPKMYAFDSKECPLKIYTNQTEALGAGSSEKILEKELLEGKAELARQKQEFEKEQFKREQQRQAEDERRKQEDIKRQQEAQEREDARRRQQEKNFDRAERVSFWRKVLIEGTKAIAAAASAAVVIIGLYVKHKAS